MSDYEVRQLGREDEPWTVGFVSKLGAYSRGGDFVPVCDHETEEKARWCAAQRNARLPEARA